jgi:hypothetical protein
MGTGKGISKIIGAGLKSPMDFSLAISKGFHNVPRLYGEEVRQVDKVTGIQSGLKTAGKELGIGLFEGITGLVTQPYKGAKKEGAKGFMKGMGKGLAGIYIKPSAGAFAIPGYAMKGVYKEIQKHFGASVNHYILAARTAQGYEEWQSTTLEQRKEVVHQYLALLRDVRGKKKGTTDSDDIEQAVHAFIEKRKQARREKWARITKKGKKKDYQLGELEPAETPLVDGVKLDSVEHASTFSAADLGDANTPASLPRSFSSNDTPSQLRVQTMPTPTRTFSYPDSDDDEFAPRHTPQSANPPLPLPAGIAELPGAQTSAVELPADAEHDPDLEAAIQASVKESSRGVDDEDEIIDRAIRASIAELERVRTIEMEEDREEQQELRRAIAMSSSENLRGRHEGAVRQGMTEEEARASERELYGYYDKSPEALPDYSPGRLGEQEGGVLRDEKAPAVAGGAGQSANHSSAGPSQPRLVPVPPVKPGARQEDADEELLKAIEESKKMHEDMEKEKREEQIVMEYVKKASLAEQEFRRQRGGGTGGEGLSTGGNL